MDFFKKHAILLMIDSTEKLEKVNTIQSLIVSNNESKSIKSYIGELIREYEDNLGIEIDKEFLEQEQKELTENYEKIKEAYKLLKKEKER